MRIKHMLTLAFAAMVAVAFAVPAVASANWTENGSEITGLQWSKDGAPLSGENGSLTLSGPLGFTSSNGGVRCTVEAPVTLNADSDSGQVTEVTGSPSSCKVTGGLAFLCGGTNKVTGVTYGTPWNVTATESGGVRKVSISVASTYTCSSGYEFSVIGTLVGTPDNSGAISSLSQSGNGTLLGPKKENLGAVSLGGEVAPLSVSPAGKYGIIKTTRNVAISGGLGWASANGGMSCTVNGNLALEAGSEGKVTSLNWSNCSFSGGQTFCGKINSVSSNSLPWTIVDQGSSIKITNFSVTVNSSGCGNETFSGEMLASPNNKSAISSTSLAGTLVKNGWQPTSWSGSVNWTPAGVYGL